MLQAEMLVSYTVQSGRIVMYGGMADGTALEDVWELRLRGKRWHWHELTCTGTESSSMRSNSGSLASLLAADCKSLA